jgi:hypothetical protein
MSRKKISVNEAMNNFVDEVKTRDTRWLSLKLSYGDIDGSLMQMCDDRMNPLVMYLKMRCGIIREGWVDHPNYPLKEKFYDNGFLVMTMSSRQMAEEFNMNRNTVRKYLNKMKEVGWIKIAPLKLPNRTEPQNVYIFGTWREIEEKVEEAYYCSVF